jgi:hypothetical protein
VSAAAARRSDATADSETPLVLRGRPTRVTASASLPSAVSAAARDAGSRDRVEILIEGVVAERVQLRRARDVGAPPRLRVRLGSSTPPGRYEGSAVVGDSTVPVVIDVQAAPRLRSSPTRFDVTAEPDAPASIEVALTNTGNVPIEIPARSSFCLFDGGGVDHAVWTALTSDPPAGKGRLDVLLDDLAVSHGGLVDVRVREGAGELPPGQGRTCRIELGWSDRLRPGRTYAGSWELAGLRLPIRVATPRDRPRTDKPSSDTPSPDQPSPNQPSPGKPSPDKPARPRTATSARRPR